MSPSVAAAEDHSPPRANHSLYIQVIAAIILGGCLGHFWPSVGEALKPLGDLFIQLVKMVIAPVIFLTVATGIAGAKEMASVGRIAAKAMAYFFVFSTLALIVGLIVGNLVQPGAGMNVDPASLDAGAVAGYAEKAHETTLVGFLSAIIPTTLVSAMTDGSILQVLLVAVFFGVALAALGEPVRPLVTMLETVSLVVFRMNLISGVRYRPNPAPAVTTDARHQLALATRPQSFSRITSCSISRSSERSATSFLSRPFSSSSCFSRFISVGSRPSYFFFQLK